MYTHVRIFFRMRIASYLYEYPEFAYPDKKRVVSCCNCNWLGYCILSDIYSSRLTTDEIRK